MIICGFKMEDVYIIDASRSAIGKFLGSLTEFSAPQIGAAVVKGMLARNSIPKEQIEELIAGNVISAGLGQNPAKQVIVYSGLPNGVSSTNVNMVCASGLRAIGVGSASISSGNSELIIAGGIESMSNAPHTIKGVRQFKKLGNTSIKEFSTYLSGAGNDPSKAELTDELIFAGLWDCYTNLHMGAIAEKLGGKYGISREEQDAFAFESHMKAAAATDGGKFKREIIPIKLGSGSEFDKDEGIRHDTDIKKLASLKPAFGENGTITAGNASQISDGASFVILASGRKVKELGLKPIAKIESFASSGIDPSWYGVAPSTAMRRALDKAGEKLDSVDLIELNEAFCVQALSVVRELGIDIKRLNVNGGATALGHPIGASGARILTTLIYAMQDRKKDLGMASLCHGGGGAAAMIIRRVS
jgi:acetyl-CoA C-acetyltransferase